MPRSRRKKNRIRWQRLNASIVKETMKKNWVGITLVLTVLAGGAFLISSLNSFLFASDHFNIKEIEIIDSDPDKVDFPLARIKDRANIFKIDLAAAAENIEREYPDIQKATVRRILPDKLAIEILRRRPVAQVVINSGRDAVIQDRVFMVNKDAYVLADTGKRVRRDLPLILGLNLQAEEMIIGRQYQHAGLRCALDFLENIRKNGFAEKYLVTKIDVTNVNNMTFHIKDNLEVKIGNRNWDERLSSLAGMIQNMDVDYSQKYYVDVRFKDIVFGKKERQ